MTTLTEEDLEIGNFISKGLHLDAITLHHLSREDSVTCKLKEYFFNKHPVLSRKNLNSKKYNHGGLLIIRVGEEYGDAENGWANAIDKLC